MTLEHKIKTVLEMKNWTGFSLQELIESGRVPKTCTEIVRDFARLALGDAKTLEELGDQLEIARLISKREGQQ